MFFVFVFKQKTAYELRISDWSSDVCSSDLACGAVDLPGAEKAGDGLNLQGRVQRSRIDMVIFYGIARHPNVGLFQPGHGSDHGQLDIGRQRSADEIGKASCRERVCQYV